MDIHETKIKVIIMEKKQKEYLKQLLNKIYTHRRFYAAFFAGGATFCIQIGRTDLASLFGAVSASFATWSLVLPKKK